MAVGFTRLLCLYYPYLALATIPQPGKTLIMFNNAKKKNMKHTSVIDNKNDCNVFNNVLIFFCFSICLPMENRDPFDTVYLVAIMGLNGAAFFIIAICYGQIYLSLGEETRHAHSNSRGEMSVAKKMALLVCKDVNYVVSQI